AEPLDGPHEITGALAMLGDAPVGPARLVPFALELSSLGGGLEDGLRQLEARHGERLLGRLAELLEGRRGSTASQREEPEEHIVVAGASRDLLVELEDAVAGSIHLGELLQDGER